MKRGLLLAFLSILFVAGHAATISEQEALSLGTLAFSHLRNQASICQSVEQYKATEDASQPDFYILSYAPSGFILIAADDRSKPILGYSLENKFPLQQMPDHVKWYLNSFSTSMQQIREHPQWREDIQWELFRNNDFSSLASYRDVAPLISTTWNQGYPYNYACPEDPGGPGGRTYAGCVATAMAQVMKKWNYPSTGLGSHSYYAAGYGTQSANFGATNYNWAAMPNNVNSLSSEVATLMYHCGVSVDMQYGANGSGAYTEDVRDALVNYFRYSSTAAFHNAESYSANVWANKLRTDLSLGRPIVYRGQNDNGGHAFVLDGYTDSNFFHFNWGWSGSYDGYFSLANLNPGNHSYNQNHGAILGIYPLNSAIVSGTVNSTSGNGIFEATVTISGIGYTATTNTQGFYSISGIPGDTYQITAAKAGYISQTQTATLVNNQIVNLNFTLSEMEDLPAPNSFQGHAQGNDAVLSWRAPGDEPVPAFEDDFESYANFSCTMDPWILVDLDGYPTYTMYNVSWPNSGIAMSYMAFNPSATTPPLTDATCHSGTKMAASFSSPMTQNDDWMISPLVQVGYHHTLSFWAKSYTSQYGYERFQVAVSDGSTDPDDFTIISGANYLNAPLAWTEYIYDLSAYSGEEIRVAIRCVSFDAFIFFVEDVEIADNAIGLSHEAPQIAVNGSKSRLAKGTFSHAEPRNSRELLGYRVYRDGVHIASPGVGQYTFIDSSLPDGIYSYTLTAMHSEGESSPVGPIQINIQSHFAPENLAATVEENDVSLSWTNPQGQQTGEWISWCNTEDVENSIGTGGPAVFDVAIMFDSADLTQYQGDALTRVKFAPFWQDCIYTIKIWSGGSPDAPGDLIYSSVAQNVLTEEWNLHVLSSPIPIPGDRLWIGYEVNTQGGYPAGCDDGPHVQGKGNFINFGGWTTLVELAPTLSYNWLIQGFVADGARLKNVVLKPLPQISHASPTASLSLHRSGAKHRQRALMGYKIYRDGSLIATINDPELTEYLDQNLENGTYQYGVSAQYSTGESAPALVSAIVNFELPPSIFTDSFESYPDFSLSMPPWTLIDIDASATYAFDNNDYPNSGEEMAFMTFNPSATTPPLVDVSPYSGEKMAASFAAMNPPNSDWLISPRIALAEGSMLKFYAKSQTDAYGLERFRVGICTASQPIPQLFTYLDGADYIEVPTNWTEYCYDLSGYANQEVYIGIRCVSWDAFVLYVDDFSIHSQGIPQNYQEISLSSGWNLVSLNVAPNDDSIPGVFGDIADDILQLKGSQGIYIPGNPYSSLAQLTSGSAYHVLTDQDAMWTIPGFHLDADMPIVVQEGWNLVAYLPQAQLPVINALSSIMPYLEQVKSMGGIFVPDNPYSTLQFMEPGKGYWIKAEQMCVLQYPQASRECIPAVSNDSGNKGISAVIKPSSMTLLARCDLAKAGDLLLAKSGDEIRGLGEFIVPEGFPATLMQIYCEEAEELSLWLHKSEGSEILLDTTVSAKDNTELGVYPDFIILNEATGAQSPEYHNELLGCYPNPFNPSTVVSFQVAEDNTWVRIDVFNTRGQKVSTLCDRNYSVGRHTLNFDARDGSGRALSSGLYIIRFKAGEYSKVAKVVLSK
jgi:hypothetical protein